MTASVRVLGYGVVFGDKVTLCQTPGEANAVAAYRNSKAAVMHNSVARVSYTRNNVTGAISAIRIGRPS